MVDGLALGLGHFMPQLLEMFRNPQLDPRDQNLIWYKSDLLLMQALMMPLTHVPSRRQFNLACQDETFRKNIAALLDRDVPELASAHAVNYIMERIIPSGLMEMLSDLVEPLIRSKKLDRFRFEGEFLVALDGTELMRWLNRCHCDGCLVAKHQDGRVDYFHQAVDAKLVTEEGLSFSLGFEFIENVNGRYEKQDCETVAGRRLLAWLKKRFPCMRICILGDALYACEGTIDQIMANNWSLFLSFLPGRLPTAYAAAEAKLAAHPRNQLTIKDTENGETRIYRWVTSLPCGRHTLHAVFVDITDKKGQATRLAYLTNHRPNATNVRRLTDQGGRQRAKIENAFNTQKNHGYNLEHAYGSRGHALKNYYAITQIAHMIHQLMAHTDLFGKLAGEEAEGTPEKKCARHVFQTIRAFVAKLADDLRHRLTKGVDAVRKRFGKIQLRFVYNTT
ncbi:MAG: hypothetical protein WCH61_07780 [bacterium]